MDRRLPLLAVLATLLAAAPAAAATPHRPTVRQTLAAADRLGVGDQARALQRRFLPGARLIAAPAGTRAKLGATRLGGAPDLPKTARWPSCNGHPLTFVGQLQLRDVRAAVPGTTRGTGMLSFFMGTRSAPDGAPEAAGLFAARGLARVRYARCFVVRHTGAATRLTHRASPRGSTPFRSAPQVLRPTLTVPDSGVAGRRFGVAFPTRDLWEPWGSLQERAASGTLDRPGNVLDLRQVLGWSMPILEDPTTYRCAGQPSRLLLQFVSGDRYDLDQTEGGYLMVVSGARDLAAGRFDRLCVEHQLD